MSVCFFVPADGGGASTSAEEAQETETTVEDKQVETLDLQLQQFWSKVLEDVKKSSADHFKTQALPLARIKKIMKLDEEVKMISSEAPILFAKAAEIFIHELTLRAWAHTEDNKRRTLQRNDIAMAIAKSDQFDFLIDIVPRQEIKPIKREDPPPRASASNETQYYQQSSSQQAQAQQQHVSQPSVFAQLTPTSSGQQASNTAGMQQSLALVQHVTPSGEVQQLPIQLTPGQLNMIRLQMQNNPNQPIIIQQAQQTPQIIQVTSGAPQQTQQVFLAQVSQQDADS